MTTIDFLKVGQDKTFLRQQDVIKYREMRIKTLCISKDVQEIKPYTFYQFYGLEKVIFEANSRCTSIGECAFSWCVFLKQVILPVSLQNICKKSFSCCITLKNIVIPLRVSEIAEEAFYYCKFMEKAIILNPKICFQRQTFAGTAIQSLQVGAQTYLVKIKHDRPCFYQRAHKFKNYNFCRAIDIEKVDNGEFVGEKVYFLWSNIGLYHGYGSNLHEALAEYQFLCRRNELRKEMGRLTPDSEINLEQYRSLTHDCKAGSEEFLMENNIPFDSTMKISDIYEISKGQGKSYLLGHIMSQEDSHFNFWDWLNVDEED